MTDPFLEDCGGWTPAPDILTRDKNYGFEGAYLWGRIRRLCQIGKGSYTISHEELGNRIGMSRRTVIKYLDRLIEDGYIEDLTPGVRNKAHTYSVKKGEDKILTGMQISHTEDDIPVETPNPDTSESDVGMRNLHSDDAEIAHQDETGMQELPNRYAKNAHPGMQNLHLDRESLETLKETKQEERGDKPPTLEGVKPKTIPKAERPNAIPGVTVFVEVTKRHVLNNTQIKEIDERVGRDPPALDKWREVVKAWQLHGNKINNISGMLDWFKKGIPVYAQKASTKNGHHIPSQDDPRPDSPRQAGGLSETSTALGAAWLNKRRGRGNTT